MKVISNKTSLFRHKFIVTIGVFDGVHRGHQHLIRHVVKRAQQCRLRSLVISFWPHPKKWIFKNPPGYIMNRTQKREAFSRLGLDWLWIMKTNKDFVAMEGEEFIRRITKRITIEELIIGEDFKFGHKRLYSIDQLRVLAKERGFRLRVIRKRKVNNLVASSSLIRECIQKAQFSRAEKLLGRPYTLSAPVIKGKGLGRRLGFPTANLDTKEFVIPFGGVYAVLISVGKKIHLGVVNIGKRPSISNQKNALVEAHIINFSAHILGKKIKVVFLKKLRDEKKFKTLESLSCAIRNDIRHVTAKYSTLTQKYLQPIVL